MAERPASGEGETVDWDKNIQLTGWQRKKKKIIKTGENLFFTLKEELILFQQQTPRTDYLLS